MRERRLLANISHEPVNIEHPPASGRRGKEILKDGSRRKRKNPALDIQIKKEKLPELLLIL